MTSPNSLSDSAQSSEPAAAFIPLCEPYLAGNESKYVNECLDTNWVSTAGQFVTQFEANMAAFVGTQHAVACTSGTAALHLALLAANIPEGAEIIVSDLTFIAPANTIRYVGAYPVLCDARESDWQMDPHLLADFLKNGCEKTPEGLKNKKTGRIVAAIMPVHILGHPVDMDPILALSKEFNLTVIEDATESLGARYKGRNVGTMGHMAALSFNGNKLITTGGGGMVLTNDAALADHVRHLSTQAKQDAVEYVHDEVGYNYRLTNLQAAMGCGQLENITDILARKKAIGERYQQAFEGHDLVSFMPVSEDVEHAFWLSTIRLANNVDRTALREHLKSHGIDARPLWQPMSQSPAHKGAHTIGGGKMAARLYNSCLSIPCSAGLSEGAQQRVIDAILAFLRGQQ